MTHRRKRVMVVAFVVIAVGLVAWWLRPAPVLVETARVTRGPLQVTVDEEGITRVRQRYVIAAPVTGWLGRMTLKEGDSVRTGAVVARVDPSLLDPRGRELAMADLQAAEDAASQARAQVAQARAAAEQSVRDLARIRQLAPGRFASPSDIEQAEATQRARQAELEGAVYRAQQLQHDVERAKAAVREPGARGTPSMSIHSPTGGRVLRILEPDQRVIAAGTPIVEVGDPRDLEVVIDVLSTEAVQVQSGAAVRIDAWGGDSSLAGRVRRIEPSAFTKTSALGIDEQRVNIIADILDPPPALGDRFRVDAHIVVWDASDVLAVPVGALFREGATWKVFVVERGRARARTVVIGHRGANDAQVLSGLAAGDTVAVHPSDQIADGVRVRSE